MIVGTSAGLGTLLRPLQEPTPPTTATTTKTVTETTTASPPLVTSLRAAAESNGLLVGAAAGTPPQLSMDYQYADVLSREFNFLTPENAMKWGGIETNGFGLADGLVNFAAAHQMRVKGHTLIWQRSLPKWVNKEMSSDELNQAVQDHIRSEVGRFKGRVYAWDVVNEAVDPNGKGLQNTIFIEKLGEDYIAEAYRLAHETDPDALLFYNDYGAEGVNAKSDRVYDLVKGLLGKGVPIHGVGLQMHVKAWDYPNPQSIVANIRRLAALGLTVNISEMDVRIKDLPGDLSSKLQIQGKVYHDIISACVQEPGFIGVTFWGFTDAHSWISNDKPLLFDEDYHPKPAYWGVMQALKSCRHCFE